MKKEYINPTIEVINLETAQMIAESTTIPTDGGSYDPSDGFDILSGRDLDIWND